MGWFEERNNDGKEEELLFGDDGSGKIRMLGSWMNWKEDLAERLKRGGRAWWKTKQRLKGAKISKRLQAKVVEASVESSMLFDCQARTWKLAEIRKMQSLVDRAYRYIWSDKKGPPLVQMKNMGKNMFDVRQELGVRSLRWKIEKRTLERMGHVMRMEDGRLVKAMVLGWLEQLERWDRVSGGRRKTVLYWKKLLREAAIDYTRIGALTKDRKVWKALVKERMEWVNEWEKEKGHGAMAEPRDRIMPKVAEVKWDCEVCGRVCKSKAGLTIHKKRVHEVSEKKKKFVCFGCKEVFKQEANLVNHQKLCRGSAPVEEGKRKCDLCGKAVGKKSFAAHRKRCARKLGIVEEEEVVSPPAARVYKSKRKPCPGCGKEMAATNIQRHLREACDGGACP